jgi:Carboxypeptidase regulatory-like domain
VTFRRVEPVEIRLPKFGVLRGRVVNEAGQGVSDALVRIARGWSPMTVRTGRDGRFTAPDMPLDSIVVEVKARGFARFPWWRTRREKSVFVSEQDAQRELIIVLRRPVSVEGRVVGGSGRRPVPGAVIRLHPRTPPDYSVYEAPELRTVADEAGRFSFEDVSPWTYTVTVTAPGWIAMGTSWTHGYAVRASPTDERFEIVVHPDEKPSPLELPLVAACAVSGSVLGPKDEPVAGAWVALGSTSGDVSKGTDYFREFLAWVRTDEAGRFEFRNLPRSTEWDIEAWRPGQTASERVRVQAPGAGYVLRLSEEGVIVAEVRDESGEIPPGVRAYVGRLPCLRDGPGRFRSRRLGVRTGYVVSAIAPGHDWARAKDVSVRPDQETVVELVLRRTVPEVPETPEPVKEKPVATGIVVDESGRPICDVLIWYGVHQLGSTDEDGRFRIVTPHAWPTSLTFSKRGLEAVEVADIGPGRTGIEVVIPDVGYIVGTVIDTKGRPCPGIRITATPMDEEALEARRQAVADGYAVADGSYRICVEARRPYALRVVCRDCLLTRFPDVVAGPLANVLTVPAWTVLDGRVVDADGKPAPRVTIRAHAERVHVDDHEFGGKFPFGGLGRTITDVRGRFRLPVFEETCTLELIPERAAQARMLVGRVRPAESGLEIVLTAASPISGRVVRADGSAPRGGGRVLAWREGRGRPYTAWFDREDPTFRFSRIPEGSYMLAALMGGWDEATLVPLPVQTGQTNVRLVIEGGKTVQGLVVGQDGRPLADRDLVVRRWTDETRLGLSMSVRTDARGMFTLGGFPAGANHLEIVFERGARARRFRAVAGGEPERIPLVR